MNDEISLYDAVLAGIALGEILAVPKTQGTISTNYASLTAALERCGLPVSLSACGHMQEIAAKCKNPTGGISGEFHYGATASANSIRAALEHEAGETIVVKLLRTKVTPELIDLDDSRLTEKQRLLRDETVRCLECGAFRSGVVMGWNLFFDILRSWVCEPQRLSSFDQELAKRINKKNRSRTYPPITKYDDFLGKKSPNERVVLDTCKKAGLIPEELAHFLIQKLNDRNMSAHASKREASLSLANHYVEELLNVIHEKFLLP